MTTLRTIISTIFLLYSTQNTILAEYALFQKQYWNDYFKDANEEDYTEEAVKRQVKLLKKLGTSALPDDDVTKVSQMPRNCTNHKSLTHSFVLLHPVGNHSPNNVQCL